MTDTSMPAVRSEPRSAFIASVDRVEVRESGEGNGDYTLTGHAAVFDRWSEELFTFAGTFREKIAPKAFDDVLAQKPDVRLFYNHDGLTLARTKSGTLDLSVDEDGLKVWARLAPSHTATDLRLAMQRGDVDQMSFMFTVAEDEWHEDSDKEEIERTILRVGELYDVSVVSMPAYPDTDATMREIREAVRTGRIDLRSVIPFRATPKADPDTAWDGPGEVARADVDDLRAMCAWVDSNNPDVKGSYKLPHHRASDGHPVVWRGVRAAMGRLMQTDIPPDDKRGCHSHLSKHYDQFDKEAPDFDELARGLDLPEEAYETRETLHHVLRALAVPRPKELLELHVPTPTGTISVNVAQAEIDPAGTAANGAFEDSALDDPAGIEEDPLAADETRRSEVLQRERESYLRLLKELSR